MNAKGAQTADKVKPAHDRRLNDLKLIQNGLSLIMKKMHIEESFEMPSKNSHMVAIHISTLSNVA